MSNSAKSLSLKICTFCNALMVLLQSARAKRKVLYHLITVLLQSCCTVVAVGESKEKVILLSCCSLVAVLLQSRCSRVVVVLQFCCSLVGVLLQSCCSLVTFAADLHFLQRPDCLCKISESRETNVLESCCSIMLQSCTTRVAVLL